MYNDDKCPICGANEKEGFEPGETVDVGFGYSNGPKVGPDRCNNCFFIEPGRSPDDLPYEHFERCWAKGVHPWPEKPPLPGMNNNKPLEEKYVKWIEEHVEEYPIGKCRLISREMNLAFPELRRIYGIYFCLAWGAREHFWLVDDGYNVIDPTASQFPTLGRGLYTMTRFFPPEKDLEIEKEQSLEDMCTRPQTHVCEICK